jgi:phytoene synthase
VNTQAQYIKESNLLLSQKGKTFFWAKFLLKTEHATNAVRLYRFCRHVDDIADDTVNKKLAKNILNNMIKDLRKGESKDPVLIDSIQLFHECKINIDIPLLLIKGVISDLSLVRFKNENELLIYCYQVAGTVGLMMSKLLDVKNEAAYAHAIDLGIGMQITNICRDVTEDAYLNRRYIPATLIGDIEPCDLINPNIDTQNKIKNALQQLLTTANCYYKSGYYGLCFLPLRARLGISIASSLYHQIGVILEKNHYQCWLFRSVVPKQLKSLLTVKTFIASLSDFHFFRYSKSHNPLLHRAIRKLPYVNASAS